MTHDDLMNFVTRGRVAQEEVDKIIATYTTKQAGGRGAAETAPPTSIGVKAGSINQRGAPQRRAPAPKGEDHDPVL